MKNTTTTAKHLREIEARIDTASASLRRINSLRMGVISGTPSNSAEQSELNAARAEMLEALRKAGPRLRKKFNAEMWERSFLPNGECA